MDSSFVFENDGTAANLVAVLKKQSNLMHL
jgi:hypothetical protein